MTAVVDLAAVQAHLWESDALLLDFDGPVCSVFAEFPAMVVAEQLRENLAQGGYNDLPIEIRGSSDPFAVLNYAGTLGLTESRYIEATLTAHECEAVQTATPTPGAYELMSCWRQLNRTLAIVSNNSRAAIEIYNRMYGLTALVDCIAAREFADTGLLKPSPYLVQTAVGALGVRPDRATFVGDSLSDMYAGKTAGVTTIGFANRPEKVDQLSKVADFLITQHWFADSKTVPGD